MANSRQYGIPVAEPVLGSRCLCVIRLGQLRVVQSLRPAIVLKCFFPALDIVFLAFLLEPLVDLILRLRTFNNRKPVAARSLRVGRRDDLDPVSILNHVIDRHQLAIDSRTNHPVSNRRMDAVGKIDGCRSIWQRLDVACGRKAVDVLVEEIQITLEQRQKFLVVRLLLPFENLAQPVHLLLFLLWRSLPAIGGFLVLPMCRDTIFSDTMHFDRPDLNLKW